MITSKFRYCYLPSVVYCIPVGPFFIRQAGKYSVDRRIFGARVFRSEKAEKSVTRCKINLGIDSRRLWKARGYSRDCRILRALSFLSSFFAAFHRRRRRPVVINFLARMRLCADSPCPTRLSEDWNRVKNCQSTERRFEDRIWLSNLDNCYSWKKKTKKEEKEIVL